MTIKLKVYSDYTCPYCYLAETAIKRAVEGKDVKVEWKPFELHPFPSDRKAIKEWSADWETSVLPHARELGRTINTPDLPALPYTGLAHQGFIYAKEQGKDQLYSQLVFSAFFEKGKDIEKKDVLAEIAMEAGLDRSGFLSALSSEEFKEKLVREQGEAKEDNITAAPTIVIGERVLKGLYPQASIEKAIRCTIRDQKMQFCEGDECQ
ncbi:Predicted dithiol-disulfide isomerase, DsbA family [Bacillus sp. OV194]|uniref:DsbA family oxidoreductase n=1 Tax=Fictibacillus sp. B-59209 TaxID=3024873 RepID=UPI0008EA924F|nr:DsbA family protein [Fictibacillus sp. B-59209]MED2973670.1 DsbA family protein [Fictibacillus sp. B-59209]SFE05076.1 Predicted dithiol-disulfide isomerase, DsbA family [Bacillus sp. OV194]